eukprot:Filipodium_phascolosomae@DN5718_c0_g1_i1.p1
MSSLNGPILEQLGLFDGYLSNSWAVGLAILIIFSVVRLLRYGLQLFLRPLLLPIIPEENFNMNASYISTNLLNSGWLFFDFLVGLHTVWNFKQLYLENLTPDGRLHTFIPGVVTYQVLKMGYEVLGIEEDWGKIDMMAHHIICFLVCWSCVHGYNHPYCLYFSAFASIPTAFLTLTQIFRKVDGLSKAMPITSMVSQLGFLVLYITMRLLLWSYFGYYLFRDLLSVLLASQIRSYYFWLLHFSASVGLSFLQLMWCIPIGKAVVRYFQKKMSRKID